MSPTPSALTSPSLGNNPLQPQSQAQVAAESSSALSSSRPSASRISSSQSKDDRHNDKDKHEVAPPTLTASPRPPIPPQTSSSSSIPHATTSISTSSSHSLLPSHSRPQSQLHSLQTQNIHPSQIGTISTEQIPSQTSHPLSFSPFFVLVDDPANKSTYHPHRVHYLFSDDEDTEVLTGALVRSLEDRGSRDEEGDETGEEGRGSEVENDSSSSETSSSGAQERHQGKEERERSKRRGGRKGRQVEKEERILIVDINEKGDAITSANSLCERWQVLNAAIESAPTFDAQNDHDGAGDANRGLMLKIEGIGVESLTYEDGKAGAGSMASGIPLADEQMRELLEGFDKKMEILRKLVGETGVEGLGVGAGTGQVDGEETGGDG